MNAEIDISNVKLETERLILRAWEITDLNNFFIVLIYSNNFI